MSVPSIALVYAKDASSPRAGMDLIRWTEIGRGLAALGFRVDLVTHRPGGVLELSGLPVLDAARVDWNRYSAIKVCYQHSIDLVPAHPRIIVRMCRVVDREKPHRDAARREETLRQQTRVRECARFVAVNGSENATRWKELYGGAAEILVVPTGCPETIPEPGRNPFRSGGKIVLYCGSLTAPRFVRVLNRVARQLRARRPDTEVHFVGRDRLRHYGAGDLPLDRSLIAVHPPVDEFEAWQYILHARVGIALAPSADAFESELAKIYYYLRGGLPVVTESCVMNRHLVEETGHGAIARFDDADDLAARVGDALDLEPRNPEVMEQMAHHHAWIYRARVYAEALARSGVENPE